MSKSHPAVVHWEPGDGQPLKAIVAANSTAMTTIVRKYYEQCDGARRRAEAQEADRREMRELEQVDMQLSGRRKTDNGGKNVA